MLISDKVCIKFKPRFRGSAKRLLFSPGLELAPIAALLLPKPHGATAQQAQGQAPTFIQGLPGIECAVELDQVGAEACNPAAPAATAAGGSKVGLLPYVAPPPVRGGRARWLPRTLVIGRPVELSI